MNKNPIHTRTSPPLLSNILPKFDTGHSMTPTPHPHSYDSRTAFTSRRRFREKNKILREEDFARKKFRKKKISREEDFARKKFCEKILKTGIDWMMIQFSRVINQTRFWASNYFRKKSFSRSRSFTNLFFEWVRACARITSLSVGVRTP